MASNKNQHFVPRCYLRAFASDSRGAAINVFNLDRRRAIPNAALRGQCSQSYFYGEDLHLEMALQQFEGPYANMLREIVQPGYRLTARHVQQLKTFWCLQYLRTEATSKRLVEASDEMNAEIGQDGDTYRLTMREAVDTSISLAPELSRHIEDLRLCLVKNTTGLDFVTSDDPAVSANRWYQQDLRAQGMAPGLGSAGALLFLPLAPDVLCLLYDGSTYTVEQQRGWVSLRAATDVVAFNEHQYLNALSNVYFQDWSTSAAVANAFELIADRRPTTRHRFHYAVFDRVEDGAQIFREVSASEAREHQHSMVHQEAVCPVPSSWPRLLRFRPDGHFWSDGSGTGFTRRAMVPAGGHGYRKYPSRRRGR